MKYCNSILLATLFLSLSGCLVNVPISYSTSGWDYRIVGYWQNGTDGAMRIFKNADQSLSLQSIHFNEERGSFELDDEVLPIYFSNYAKNGVTYNYASYGDKKGYFSAQYDFYSENEMSVKPLNTEFLSKYSKATDDDYELVKFASSTEFRNFVKNNAEYEQLYQDEIQYVRRSSLYDLRKPKQQRQPRRDGTYEISKMRTREYLPAIRAWDNYSDWFDVEENTCTAKFFSSGMRLNLNIDGENIEFYGANLSYDRTVKSTSGTYNFYVYKGLARHDDQLVGNIELAILEHQYSELVNGSVDDARFDVSIDQTADLFSRGGFWRTLEQGGFKQVEMNFQAIPR